MKCALKLVHVWMIDGLALIFSTESKKIFALVMMILLMLIICSGILGLPYDSIIAHYWLITLKTFAIGS